MAQSIILKRSATSGKVPTTSSLSIGELAINTYDGKVFLKKSGSSESIQTLVTTDSITTGSLTLTGDMTVLGSINARQFNIGVISSSILYTSGSNKFGDTQDDTHEFTGSISVSGSLLVNGVAVSTGSSGAGGAGVFDFNLDPSAGTIGYISDTNSNYTLQANATSIQMLGGATSFATITSASATFEIPIVASIAATNGVISGSSQLTAINTTTASLNTSVSNINTFTASTNTSITNLNSATSSYETKGRGIVSGSSQITYASIGSIPSGIISGAAQITPLLPAGTVSGSSQINLVSTTNYASGIKTRLDAEAVLSGSLYLSNYSTTVTINSAGGFAGNYGTLIDNNILSVNAVYIVKIRYVSSYSPYYISGVFLFSPAAGNAANQQAGFEHFLATSAGNGTDSYIGILGKTAASGETGGIYAKFPYGNVNSGGGTAYVNCYKLYT